MGYGKDGLAVSDKIKLYPFQQEGVQLIEKFNGRCLLADEMGLGKGVQTLAWIKQYKPFPALVVCPAGLRLNWKREAERFGLKPTILYGLEPNGTKALSGKKLYIIGYECLNGWLRFLIRQKLELVAGDEVHYISSLKAQRYKAFRKLCEDVPCIIGISGTPLTNRPFELWPILNILHPHRFPSPFAFGHTYSHGEKSFGGWTFKGAKKLPQLHHKLKQLCMIRRLKSEVGLQLPPKRQFVVPVEIERKEYDKAESDFAGWLLENYGAERMHKALSAERYTKFSYLKRLAAELKLKEVLNWIDNFLEESEGRLLVGTIHRKMAAEIVKKYQCPVIQGGTSHKQRQKAEERFNKDRTCRLLVGQIQAAGEGLNFPDCAVLFAELPWTPGKVKQFIDRSHRITSKIGTDAYFLVAVDTIEEVLCEIIQRKDKTLGSVLDGKPTREDSLNILDMLQKIVERKYER